jgi:hypothetical protein
MFVVELNPEEMRPLRPEKNPGSLIKDHETAGIVDFPE